jgi:hypothetical protein
MGHRRIKGELARLGHYVRIPEECAFLDTAAWVDPAELTRAGFDFLRPLIGQVPAEARAPDRVREREQRRSQRMAASPGACTARRCAYAVDGEYCAAPDTPTIAR